MSVLSAEVREARQGADRLVLLDALKCLAAFGIVAFHVKAPMGALWYSGMFLFLFFLGYNSAHKILDCRYLFRRLRRLILPWSVWCIVYWILYWSVGKAWLPGAPLDFGALLVGPSVHLWFLPFAFIANVTLAGLYGKRQVRAVELVLTTIAVFPGYFWLSQQIDLPEPFRQWSVAFPMCWLGFAVASVERRSLQIALTALGGAIFLGGKVLIGGTGMLQSFLAIPFCAACLWLPLQYSPFVAYLGGLTMGVYLIHPAVIAVVRKGIPGGEQIEPFGLAAIVFTLSLALVAALRLSPRLRLYL